MTAESIALTRRMVTRILVFIFTLIVGLGVGQIFSFHGSATPETVITIKEVPDCSRSHR